MTKLKKSIRRVTESTRSHSGRTLVIEIRPGATELVFLRESGRRLGYAVPISKVYQLGARLFAESEIADRAAKRKAKKNTPR